ncbi:rRNA maturation RNase YbeY [Candidatus Peregrinibacteria bacterium]|nr:rRNA maturation RNase YbeY [Candidatus Peregrinibacteria bacterium]
MDIQFINCGEWGIKKTDFDKCIRRLKEHVPDVEGILNVVFVNDDYIQSLNKQYRHKDQPTDVISFSYIETSDFKDTGLIGEIYISVPIAKKQAKKGLEDELNKLFVHGFLHIFGHNHESEKDFKKMNKIEREVLG